MQTFRKLPTASPKNAENIVNNRWPSSILSTACHGSEIKILEPFVVVIVRLVVSVQQHVFVLTGGCVARDCPDIALLETENTFETFDKHIENEYNLIRWFILTKLFVYYYKETANMRLKA